MNLIPERFYSLFSLPLLDCLLFCQVVSQLVLPRHPLRGTANISRLSVLVLRNGFFHFPSDI